MNITCFCLSYQFLREPCKHIVICRLHLSNIRYRVNSFFYDFFSIDYLLIRHIVYFHNRSLITDCMFFNIFIYLRINFHQTDHY
ncbi:hypothetical protein G7051_04965 [Dysgonomonas sp. HDW5B]|nr:hypothetical protein G7051_04965 [Dysgonomonas sp. HDW5B]